MHLMHVWTELDGIIFYVYLLNILNRDKSGLVVSELVIGRAATYFVTKV